MSKDGYSLHTVHSTQPAGVWGARRAWYAARALREPARLVQMIAGASEADEVCDELRERSAQMLMVIDYIERLSDDLLRRIHLEELNVPPPKLEELVADSAKSANGDRLALAERQLAVIERTLRELSLAARAAMHGHVSPARRRTFELIVLAIAGAQELRAQQLGLLHQMSAHA